MNIQQFTRELNEGENPSVLLQALRGLRSFDLDEFRKIDGLHAGWGMWPADGGLAQPPEIYVRKPELRS